MTMTLSREDRNVSLVVGEADRRLASTLHEALLEHPEQKLAVAEREAARPLPPALGKLLAQVIEAMAAGHTVMIGSLPEELSTSVAAQQLGVSRPTLMKMIRQGDIPSHKVGSHHRLKAADVLALKRDRRAAQRQALVELNDFLDEADQS